MADAKLGLSLDDLIKSSGGGKPSGGGGGGVRDGLRKGLPARGRAGARATGSNGAARPAAVTPAAGGRAGAKGVAERVASALGVLKPSIGKGRAGKPRSGRGGDRPGRATPKGVAAASYLDRDAPAPYETTYTQPRQQRQQQQAPRQQQQPVRAARAPSSVGAGVASRAPNGMWQHDLFPEAAQASQARRQQQQQHQEQPQARRAAAPAPAPVPPASSKLMISNLDFNVSEDDLHELFSVCGRITKHHINYGPQGSKGTAEVTFSNPSEAKAALQKYNNVALDGKKLVIALAAVPAAVISTLASGISVTKVGAGGPAPQRPTVQGLSTRSLQQGLQQAMPSRTMGRDDGYSMRGGVRGPPGIRPQLKSGVVRSARQLDNELGDYMQE